MMMVVVSVCRRYVMLREEVKLPVQQKSRAEYWVLADSQEENGLTRLSPTSNYFHFLSPTPTLLRPLPNSSSDSVKFFLTPLQAKLLSLLLL
jgi:hypothetical protein